MSDENRKAFNAEILFELERILSKPEFLGVPIGSTMGDLYVIELFQGKWKANVIKSIKGRLLYYLHLNIPISELRSKEYNYNIKGSDKFLLTYQRLDIRFTGIVLPMIEALGADNCIVIGQDKDILKKLPPQVEFLTWRDTSTMLAPEWKREIRNVIEFWHKSLKSFTEKYKLSSALIPKILHLMVAQSQRVKAYGRMLEDMKPRAVITEYDRNTRSSCLILSAKKLNIPTMTQIHGVVNPPYGYVPILADVAYCWGDIQRQQLEAMGAEAKQLKITGCIRLNRELRADPREAKKKVGLDPDRGVIVYASNPIRKNHKLKVAEDFCSSMTGKSDLSAVMRLHPVENRRDYQSIMERYPDILFLNNEEWSVDESLSAADIVVVRDSGFGVDALIKRKPVIVLNTLDISFGNGRELVEKAGCPFVKDIDSLYSEIKKIQTDDLYRKIILEKINNFVKLYCYAFGEDAAINAAEDIVNRTPVS